jgi:hypothetical protein
MCLRSGIQKNSISDSGSRGQKGTESLIPDPDSVVSLTHCIRTGQNGPHRKKKEIDKCYEEISKRLVLLLKLDVPFRGL